MTTPNEYGQARAKRHEARQLLTVAIGNTAGERGIDKDHQLKHVDNALEAAKEAVVRLEELREVVADRDWDTYRDGKRRWEANNMPFQDLDDDDDDEGEIIVFTDMDDDDSEEAAI